MSVTGFNRRRREARKAKNEPRPAETKPAAQEDGGRAELASDEQGYRQKLMDAIEAATGKRPGINTKTETLEKRAAETQQE